MYFIEPVRKYHRFRRRDCLSRLLLLVIVLLVLDVLVEVVVGEAPELVGQIVPVPGPELAQPEVQQTLGKLLHDGTWNKQ